jgi:hypothetical protein
MAVLDHQASECRFSLTVALDKRRGEPGRGGLVVAPLGRLHTPAK